METSLIKFDLSLVLFETVYTVWITHTRIGPRSQITAHDLSHQLGYGRTPYGRVKLTGSNLLRP